MLSITRLKLSTFLIADLFPKQKPECITMARAFSGGALQEKWSPIVIAVILFFTYFTLLFSFYGISYVTTPMVQILC